MKLLFLNFETALGAAVHATPVFAAVRRARPDWELHAISSGIAADVVISNPRFDKLWTCPHFLTDSLKAIRWLLARRSELGEYDQIVFNTGNCRTKMVIGSYLVKARRRVGFSVRPGLVDEVLHEEPQKSLIANNLQLLSVLGIDRPVQFAPEIWFGEKEAAESKTWRSAVEQNRAPVIGFFAGTSGGHPNQWYDDRFTDLANKLHQETGATSVFFGGGKDMDHVRRLAQDCAGPVIEMAGKTSITQLAAMIAVCDLIVSVDTGGLHVAWAVGTPTLVLGHAANPRHIWLPAGNPKVSIIRKDDEVPCALCRKHFCATRECMDEITLDEVHRSASDLLQNYPPDELARVERLARWTSHGNPMHSSITQ